MRLIPNTENFRKWASCVPSQGDLIFLDRRTAKDLKNFPYPILTTDEIRAQSLNLWTLNARSWYGYALNAADFGAWLPKGCLEKLPLSLQRQLALVQVKLKIPSLILSRRLPPRLQGRLFRYRNYCWVTSQQWAKLGMPGKIAMMRAWFQQNELMHHESVALNQLPDTCRKELKRIGFHQLLNNFPMASGHNCLATAAGAIAARNHRQIARQWLHEKPFLNFLRRSGFAPISVKNPEPQDVLVFSRNHQVLHAGYCIGEGFYFEKPGQDFYEPYRIEKFKNWKTDRPQTSLTVWRRFR